MRFLARKHFISLSLTPLHCAAAAAPLKLTGFNMWCIFVFLFLLVHNIKLRAEIFTPSSKIYCFCIVQKGIILLNSLLSLCASLCFYFFRFTEISRVCASIIIEKYNNHEQHRRSRNCCCCRFFSAHSSTFRCLFKGKLNFDPFFVVQGPRISFLYATA